MQIKISWLHTSQLIWIYTVCKGSVYPSSAGQGLIYPFLFFSRYRFFCSKINTKQIMAVYMVLTLLTSDVSGSCRRRLSVQIIRYEDCVPKRLLTYSCVGTCSTHAQIASSYPFEIERTCYQCMESVVQDRRVKLKCPDADGPSLFKDVRITIQVPKQCMCEVCNARDSIDIMPSHEGNNSNET